MQTDIFILATSNPGKIRELAAILAPLGFQVQGIRDILPDYPSPEETGKTFQENALIKARDVWEKTKGWTNRPYVLSDDSGLECEDLEGAPGVHSARFAGEKATDEENNQKLVTDLKAAHDSSRNAQYVCVLCLINPDGEEILIRETCQGVITFVPSGTGGFGYDPYFYLPDSKCTMAELPLEVKNEISHRGKALKKLLAMLSSQA